MCLLSYDNDIYGTYKLCQVLQTEISMSGQMRKVKVGYEEKEIGIGMQRLVLLMLTDEVRLLRMSTDYDCELPGACCPGLPPNTAQ